MKSPYNKALLKLNSGASEINEIKPPLHWYFVFNTKFYQFFTVNVDVVVGIDESISGNFFT